MLIPARELRIVGGDDPRYWKWTHHDSCSSEVAELLDVCWLEISGKVDARELQVKTSHSAFLVFKLRNGSYNLEKATASVRFQKEIIEENRNEGYIVFIDRHHHRDANSVARENGRFPRIRDDEWLEIKLGDFFNDSGDDDEGDHVEMMLFNWDNPHWKSGLIVRGIDVRPNLGVSSEIWFDCPNFRGTT